MIHIRPVSDLRNKFPEIEDLVLKDKTGILLLDYSPLIRFLSFFFALFRVPKLIGKRVRVFGWYHRGPIPYLQVKQMITENNRKFTNHWHTANRVFNWILFLLGIWLSVIGAIFYFS